MLNQFFIFQEEMDMAQREGQISYEDNIKAKERRKMRKNFDKEMDRFKSKSKSSRSKGRMSKKIWDDDLNDITYYDGSM